MRILVAQHRASLASHLEEELAQQHLDVVRVQDGVEALNALATGPFAGLILALDLPLVDGLQLLLRLRSDDSWRDVPAVLTGGALPWSREEARSRLGAVDWFPEGFSASDVVAPLLSQLGLGSGTIAAAPASRLPSLGAGRAHVRGASWPHLYTVLLVDLFLRGADGTLHLGRRDADQLQITFLGGHPTWAFRGSEPWADVSAFLRDHGAVGEEELRGANALRGRRLAERLAHLKGRSPALSASVRTYVRSRLLEPFGWRSGATRFSPGEDQAVEMPFGELHPIPLISRKLGSLVRRSEVTALLSQLGNTEVAATSLAPLLSPWLEPEQANLLQGLGGGTAPAAALASMLGPEGGEALYVLFALGCIGAVAAPVDLKAEASPPAGRPRPRKVRSVPAERPGAGAAPEAPPAAFVPPPEPVSPRLPLPAGSCPTAAALCAPLAERIVSIGRHWGRPAASHFEVLGLEVDASERARDTRATSLSALLLPGGLPPSLQAKALSLRRRLIQARYILRDDQARRRVAHELSVGVAVPPHTLRCPLVQAPIRQGFLSGGDEPALTGLEEALGLLYAEQWTEALAQLEVITREHPTRLDAALGLAWARMQARDGLPRALEACQLAERIDPGGLLVAETRARILLVDYRRREAAGERSDATPLHRLLDALEAQGVVWANRVRSRLPVAPAGPDPESGSARGRWFNRS